MSKADSLAFEFESTVNFVDAQTRLEGRPPGDRLFHAPHPIPYQGSKRNLAPEILAKVSDRKFRRLYEPFAGSAAITITAANMKLANEYVISDALQPLMSIWNQILSSPHTLANDYERLWSEQLVSDASYYYKVRDDFNRFREPAALLYLLARCVKNALRFNQQGDFNQSYDKRRLGMHPNKMRIEILGASLLLAKKAKALGGEFEATLAEATADDLVYLDPPYEGTSSGINKRYYKGVDRDRLIATLCDLNQRGVPYLLSYDGCCGTTTYGSPLPEDLHLTHLELVAGRSSQATLSGRSEITVESLYVSRNLFSSFRQ
ncbi:MAG TPA: Dam family site-specific DNA-(adenine-N6)-methyltransferase [Ktedonobacteraceae bacterium]|nr:Dam family site-specific DNA-(adenine-N6)-methyltransferase [Ktedonobacteraceae bacterium]